jgi:hypothetical protein
MFNRLMHGHYYLDVRCLMSNVAERVTLMYGERSYFLGIKNMLSWGGCNEISLFHYCLYMR